MAIFLLILKIIGYILLALLGLVVFLLLILLFAPFRYRVNIWNEEAFGGDARITWLLHFIQVAIPFDEGMDGMKGYIFWGKVPVYPKKYRAPKKAPTEFEPDDLEIPEDSQKNLNDVSGDAAVETLADEAKPEIKAQTVTEANKPKKTKKPKKPKDPDKKSFSEKMHELREALSEENRQTIKKLLKEVVYLLKKICPKKAEGYVDYGFSSPDITGEILAVIAATPIVYKTGLDITPDFETEETYAKCRVSLKGKIQLYILVRVAADILIDKQMREFVQKFI